MTINRPLIPMSEREEIRARYLAGATLTDDELAVIGLDRETHHAFDVLETTARALRRVIPPRLRARFLAAVDELDALLHAGPHLGAKP